MDEDRTTHDWFSKPGDSMRFLMQRRRITASELAESFDGGLPTVRGILDGSVSIDQAKARTLSQALGGSSDFWLKRQANYEIALDQAVGAVAEKEADEWLRRIPVGDAKLSGPLSGRRRYEELRRRLAFYNVSSLSAWERRYGRFAGVTRFRTSKSFPSTVGAILLWLRRGELEADLVSTHSWNPERLRDRLNDIRRLSRISRPERFLPRLKEICADVGVAVVIVKAPKGCSASGASTLVSPDKALMLLSFRYRADDQFWFTVFHELGHLLLHGANTFIDDDTTPDDALAEQEANHFASSCIIPQNRISEFRQLSHDRDSVIRFSVSIGVSPGLVVGQMQHSRMIGHNRLNTLKRRWSVDEIAPEVC